jgi:hypothetical protein
VPDDKIIRLGLDVVLVELKPFMGAVDPPHPQLLP